MNKVKKLIKIAFQSGKYQYIADYFEIDEQTIERYLEDNNAELENNGYEVLRANRLNRFKLAVNNADDSGINVGVKSRMYGIFDFRFLLNIGCF